jgi:hypothetical protein
MSGHRFDNRLSEPSGLSELDERVIAEAEADLDRLLSIEPSSDFAATVRARINADRASSSRWFTGWQLSVAAASLLIVGIIVTYAMRRGATEISQPAPIVASVQPPPTQLAPAVAITTPARTPDVVVTNPVVSQPSHRSLPRATGEQRAASSEQRVAKGPEVLVPADQRIAIARALAMSRTGALDERMFAEPLPAVAGDDAPSVPPIVVEDVVVLPIAIPDSGTEKDSGRTDSKL